MPHDTAPVNKNTLLLRQIHPDFWEHKRVSRRAFIPSREGNFVSVDNGDLVSAEEAYSNYIGAGGKSIGVFAITVGECQSLGLKVQPDPLPENASHVHIVFPPGLSNSQTDKLKSALAAFATARKALFLAPGSG